MPLTRSKFLLYAFLIIYILGGIIATALSYIYNFNEEHIGLAFLFASLIAIYLINKDNFSLNKNISTYSKNFSLILTKTSLVIITILWIIAIAIFINSMNSYTLPLNYFVVITCGAFIIAMQIFFSNNPSKFNAYLVLIEILITSLILSLSFLFLIPGVQGNDSPYHTAFINTIFSTGRIDSFYGTYQNYPVYQLLFVFYSFITGISDLKILQSLVLVTQTLFLIFLFLAAKKLFNAKIALLSTLLVSLASYFIQPLYTFYPSSFSVILFMFVLFALFCLRTSIPSFLILIIAFITAELTHPLTPVIFVGLFVIIFAVTKLLGSEKSKVSLKFILFAILLIFARWVWPIGSEINLLSPLVSYFRAAFTNVNPVAVIRTTLAPLYSYSVILLSAFGFTLLIFFAIIGAFSVLYTVSNKIGGVKNNSGKLKLAFTILIFVPIPYVLTLIFPQSAPERWFPFIVAIAGIFCSFSLILFSERILNRKSTIVVVLLTVIVVFFMITTPIADPNNKIYSTELSVRSGLIPPEITAASFLNSFNTQTIHANTKYIPFINNSLSFAAINPDNPSSYSTGTLVIRNYDLINGFTIPLFGSGSLEELIYANQSFYNSLLVLSKVFSNTEVTIYNH